MGSAENKAVVKAYFDAVNKGHLTDDLLDHLTDDVTWWIQKASPSAGTYEG
jgi:ketosteroid isomerase-like protein